MLNAKARWKVQQNDELKVEQLVNELGVVPLVAKLLLNRGIETVEAAKQFLYKENVEFYDPFLLDGMEKAITRIEDAIAQQEKILIFGDYDADGVSSTSVMVYTLREKKANFDFYIPNRFTEGYGPNEPALRWAKQEGYSLVVTVDTGISAVHEATVAKEVGLDFIVTDHHEPPPILPDAYSIINPKKSGCAYPFKGLAGVGVAFKVAHALLGRVPTELLDIVAIGTIADLVPLIDENRLLAKRGIELLQLSQKPGIKALKEVCGLEGKGITAEHIGFGIGPRINAIGRLESADPAVELLTTEDEQRALDIAADIDQLNKQRQELVNQMTAEAVEQVESLYPPEENSVLIIGQEGWNPGVIGIVASRLVEKFYRPTIVLSINEEKGEAKGSARSIEGFDMFANLSENRDILPHFGGHPMAAGLTIDIDQIDKLRQQLNRQAEERLTKDDFIPVTRIDLVATPEEVTVDVIEQMEQLAPFGISNPTPVVMLEDVNISQLRRIGSDENHLKASFEQAGSVLEAIGFQKGYLYEEINTMSRVSAVGKLSINEWNGYRKPQLMLEDLAVREWQLFDLRGARNLVEKLQRLPLEKLLLVCFRKETREQSELQPLVDRIQLLGPDGESNLNLDNSYLVLLDLPNDIEQLQQLLKNGKPNRIYSVFSHEDEQFFTSNPTREQFRWYYGFLVKQLEFDLNKHADRLAKHKGWSKNTIHFMSQVFFELEFVTINNGLIQLVDKPGKKDLSHSATYRRKQNQNLLEDQFVYSTYHELKKWFDEGLKKQSKLKETIN